MTRSRLCLSFGIRSALLNWAWRPWICNQACQRKDKNMSPEIERTVSISPLAELRKEDRSAVARRHVESAELWLRRVIHHQFSKDHGADFLQIEGLINKKIRVSVQKRVEKNPGKYSRNIDATTFDQSIDIACNRNFFNSYFQEPLTIAYPNGHAEARTFLLRLKEIRDDISHGQNCSVRQLEQAICYSNDLIDSLKQFFLHIGMQQEFNVPSIVRFNDNLGNTSSLEDVPENVNSRFIDWRQSGNGNLNPGDTLVAEIEVDPSFRASEYTVSWHVFGHERGDGPVVRLIVENKHVNEQFELKFQIVCDRDWHRFHGCDEGLGLIYRVLPPVS